MKKTIIILLSFVVLLPAGEYQLDKDKSNLVKFISDAPIENFEGITDKIDGYVFWQGSDMTAESDIYLEVDLNSLDTGIGLRNRHMRENYLETEKYPLTYFQGKITDSRESGKDVYTVKAEGIIFIHGVKRNLEVQGTISGTDGEFRIHCEFAVKLSDFKIKIPSIMFYKINEEMQLVLDFYVKK